MEKGCSHLGLCLRLVLAYDGSRYLGWQKTSEGPSIQEEVENALSQVLQQPVHVEATSRTDRGVHATGQVARAVIPALCHISIERLSCSLHALLPKDIALVSLEQAPLSFHPTLDAKEKEYHYFLCTGRWQFPHHRLYSWHVPKPLRIDLMREAAEACLGTRDFTSFTNQKKNEFYSSHECTLSHFSVQELPNHRLCLCVRGNRFLYKMVRNLVGAVVAVGKEEVPVVWIPELFLLHDRKKAAVTAPSHGLFLQQVWF